MSAPTITLPAAPAVERAPAGGGARAFWLAGLYYLIAAVTVTMWLWRDPASRIVAANPYDSDQSAWFFRYDAVAIAHLHLPALVAASMNAPQGVNLMWNTPMMLPGVLLAPVTLVAGAQVSLTLLMTVGFAGSALAMFAVLRRWGASVTAAAVGGLVYGFSPALIQSAQGHYDLQFAVLPPLMIDAVLRLATGRCAGRRAAIRCGAWLGLLMAAQVFITEELVFDSGIAALVLLAVLAAARPREVAVRVGDVLAGACAAIVVTAAVAGYPLWVQFFGPLRQHGSPFPADHYKNDLAGLVRPSSFVLLHTHGSAAFAAAFQGGLPEYLAYLGWPMLLVLAVAAVLFWRQLGVRAVAVTFVVLEVLSLGGTLLAGGHEHAWFTLPWYWVQSLPVAVSAIPDRFSILADGAAAALLAFGIDAALARWPATRWPATRQPAPERPAPRRPAARWVVAVVAAAAIIPIVPRPLPAGTSPGVPAGWTAAFSALRLPAGSHVLVVPIPGSGFTEPLRWQEDTGEPSAIVGGYFMGPDRDGKAATDGAGLPASGQYLNWLWAQSVAGGTSAGASGVTSGGTPGSASGVTSGVTPAGTPAAGRQAAPPAVTRAQVLAQLAAWYPAGVVAVTGAHSALGRYLTGLLGPPAVSTGGVLGWRLSTHAQPGAVRPAP